MTAKREIFWWWRIEKKGEYGPVRSILDIREKDYHLSKQSTNDTVSPVANVESSSEWKGNNREEGSFSDESLSRVTCTFYSNRDSQLGLHENQQVDKGYGQVNEDEDDVEGDKISKRFWAHW